RHGRARRALGDPHIRAAYGRFRALGQRDRRLPGGRAHVQAVPLHGAQLGALAPPQRESARLAGLEPPGAGQAGSRDARAAAHQRGRERVLALGPRPLRLRGPEFRGAPALPDGEARGRVGRGGLARGAGCRGAGPERPPRAPARPPPPTLRRGELSPPAGPARGRAPETTAPRTRQSDFRAAGIPWLGMPIAKLAELESVLVVGSTLRKEQPLLAARLRVAARK